MTRTFTYTFDRLVKDETCQHWRQETVTLKKRVTDKMEDRDWMKPGYAAGYFNSVLREKYGWKKSVVFANSIKEI